MPLLDTLWTSLARPVLFMMDPEGVHEATMDAFARSAAIEPFRLTIASQCRVEDPRLACERFGIRFPAPLGLAAGFDKNARWFDALHALGFGFIEVGTLTGHGQPGNAQPRLFRLPGDQALINRLGFNNRGSADAAASLAAAEHIRPVLGINIGKSKIVPNEDAAADYLASFDRLAPFAAYVAINVSSPNTQGLRDLQHRDALAGLLGALAARNRSWAAERDRDPVPLLVKLAPDLSEEQHVDAVELVEELGIDGIIATNTTIAREPLSAPAEDIARIGMGGLSGRPLTQKSRAFVHRTYEISGGRVPIVGVGGVFDGDDAYEMLRAGASLVQAYTGFVYGGPLMPRRVHERLLERMQADGATSIDEVVGAAHR